MGSSGARMMRRTLETGHACGADAVVESRRHRSVPLRAGEWPISRSTATAWMTIRPTSIGRMTTARAGRASIQAFRAAASSMSVREDPVRPGLLYAGTERGMFVSFDDGAHWQPLQQNLPITSVRDIDVHGDDLVIATHGRGFWIMDDVSGAAADGSGGVRSRHALQARGRDPPAGRELHRNAAYPRTSRWRPILQMAPSSTMCCLRPCRVL